MKKLKDFKYLNSYDKLIYEHLFRGLWKAVYEPLFKIMNNEPPKAKNSISSLVRGLKRGDIYYSSQGFRAKKKFTNEQAKTLIKLGARYDKFKKVYYIRSEDIPSDILVAIAENKTQLARKVEQLKFHFNLVEGTIEDIVRGFIFDNDVKSILTNANGEIRENARKINIIEPDLSEAQKEKIAKDYTENMQYYIKNWQVDRIKKMRQRVQEAVLDGYREDTIQKILVNEYNIAQNKAKFLAHNETSIMLAEYKKATYTEMGFEKFIWISRHDGLTRQEHKDLDGHIFSFNNPPVIDERTGQTGLPGETYNCRCRLIPIMQDTPFMSPTEFKERQKYEQRTDR